MTKSSETLVPFYTIGQTVNRKNAWIARAELVIDSETQKLETIQIDGDMLEAGDVISEGTFGTVCQYTSPTTGRTCAVKAAKEVCEYDTPGDLCVTKHQMGHPAFFQPTQRTRYGNVLRTAFYGTRYGYQLMELGENNAMYAYYDGLPYAKFETFLVQATLELIRANLCYTDFKLGNIIYHYDKQHQMVLRLADVDSIGCCSVQENFGMLQNRVSTYPLFGNQRMLGYPICDLLQTWYSALVTLYTFRNLELNDKRFTKLLQKLVHTRFHRSSVHVQTLAHVFYARHPLIRFLEDEEAQKAFKLPRLKMVIASVVDTFSKTKIPLRSVERTHLAHVQKILMTSLELLRL